ncbi:unnamed protein product [Peniophora sp. CBMAI 1063]|nr:unnamed protein product [Peniophora sp. CBMAI 1063]
MGPVDPTYPLYPVASTLAGLMMLFVLLTSLIRQNWNLGVAFLCFWLLFENVTYAADTIVWSDNIDLKSYAFCDFASRLDMATYIAKPMSTLIITRRLYLVASLQSIDLPNTASRRFNMCIEWTLGFIFPLLVAGPIYYVHQELRFVIQEGFGCGNAVQTSILEILTIEIWTVIPPLVSIIFYYLRTFYLQSRDTNSFLRSSRTVSRTSYIRILCLASIDLLFTLPIGIVNLVLIATDTEGQTLPFYGGWMEVHEWAWEPLGISYAEVQAGGTTNVAENYFARWVSVALSFGIFGIFGLTSEARASYWSIIYTVLGLLGCKPTSRARNLEASFGEIEFGPRTQDSQGMTLGDVETGVGTHQQSFVGPQSSVEKQSEVDTVLEGMEQKSDDESKVELRKESGEYK